MYKRQKKHFVIDALIRNEIADPDYLDTCLSDLQVNPGTKKRLLIIQSSPDGHNNSSSLEQKIIGLFGTLGITLYTFYYPNEYLAVLDNLLAVKRKSVHAENEYELNNKLVRFALSRGFEMKDIRHCITLSDENDELE